MWLEASASGLAAGAGLGWAIRGRSSPCFGSSVWRGPKRLRQIALTFDDGPSEFTGSVLEVLDTFSARATFFQCGRNVERMPAMARRVVEMGHEIGNHTWSHPRLLFCSPARVREEIHQAQRAIREAAGVEPRWFRPPYGIRGFGLPRALESAGLTTVMWSVMGYDWDWEAEEIADHVGSHVSNGAVVCLHDGDRISARVDRHHTVRALRRLVPKLYSRGFSFVTVSQMFDDRPQAPAELQPGPGAA